MRGQINLPVYGDYVGKAIREIRSIAQSNTMCVRFSGGKDSVVLKWLFEQAGVPYQARFSRTSVDPPELLQFIKKHHTDVICEDPRISMFQLIIKKGFPPTRVCRYCCQEYYRKKAIMERNRKNSCFYRTFPLSSFHNTFITSVQDLSAKTKGHRFFAMTSFHLL